MEIDRSNYEIWIIDWLDGKLNSYQTGQLNLFLDQNSDLREEFNDMTNLKLLSPGITFPYKENLKKLPSDIGQSQFDYLCAAYLENDLTPNQKKEVEEIAGTSPDRKRTFDNMQKTIIVPERIKFKHKNILQKRTIQKNVIRLSVKGLSIAAAISLIIIVYSVIPSTTSFKKNNFAHNAVSDSKFKKPSSEIAIKNQIMDSITLLSEKKREPMPSGINKKDNISTHERTTIALSDDSFRRINDSHELSVEKIRVHSQGDLIKSMARNTLIPCIPKSNLSSPVEESNHAGRFISKTFREKFLKEKSPADSPLKGYEIAEAGVTGLNKLLGWQMALDMKKDENGQPKSVSFSSGILKIQAPVKKREPQP